MCVASVYGVGVRGVEVCGYVCVRVQTVFVCGHVCVCVCVYRRHTVGIGFNEHAAENKSRLLVSWLIG